MGGKVSKLVLVARNNPEVYGKFLANIAAGCSLASSAAAVGLSPKAPMIVLGKVKRGGGTREEKKVAKDIKMMLGKVLGLTEAEVRKLDPKYWLTHGPGRIITNEWNDEAANNNSNDKTASNSISSKDVTDALIQLYKCGISIDGLIESGQISTLQIGAAPNQSSSMVPARLNQTTGEGGSAGVAYGESSWGSKVSDDSPTSTSHNPTTASPNHLPVICNDKSYNPPPKLFVASEPVELIDSIHEPPKPIVEGRRISRVPKVPGKKEPFPPPGLQEHLDRAAEEYDGDPTDWSDTVASFQVSDEHPGSSLMDLVGSQGASEVHPLVSLQGSGSTSEIGNLSGLSSSSQEDQGKGQIGPQAPVGDRKSRSPIAFTHDRNYDGPKIEKVSVMKVDPKSVPVVAPESPGKKRESTLPPTNADIARKQHHQKNEEMEEALAPIDTLPDGLREFLSQKGIV